MEAVARYLPIASDGRKRPFTFRPDIGLAEYLLNRRAFEDAALIPPAKAASS